MKCSRVEARRPGNGGRDGGKKHPFQAFESVSICDPSVWVRPDIDNKSRPKLGKSSQFDDTLGNSGNMIKLPNLGQSEASDAARIAQFFAKN